MQEVPGRGPQAGSYGWSLEKEGVQVCGVAGKMVQMCVQRKQLLCVVCA